MTNDVTRGPSSYRSHALYINLSMPAKIEEALPLELESLQ